MPERGNSPSYSVGAGALHECGLRVDSSAEHQMQVQQCQQQPQGKQTCAACRPPSLQDICRRRAASSLPSVVRLDLWDPLGIRAASS